MLSRIKQEKMDILGKTERWQIHLSRYGYVDTGFKIQSSKLCHTCCLDHIRPIRSHYPGHVTTLVHNPSHVTTATVDCRKDLPGPLKPELIVKPKSSPKSNSQIQLQNPKSKVKRIGTGTGADTKILMEATHPPPNSNSPLTQ